MLKNFASHFPKPYFSLVLFFGAFSLVLGLITVTAFFNAVG